MVEELGHPLNEVIDDLLCQFCSIEELYDHKDDIIQYLGCDDMADVAYHLIDEYKALGEIPDRLKITLTMKAFARDLDLGGCFVETRCGVLSACINWLADQHKCGSGSLFHCTAVCKSRLLFLFYRKEWYTTLKKIRSYTNIWAWKRSFTHQ